MSARDPWVLRCPKGHTTVRHRRTLGKTFCESCEKEWEGAPIDAREVDSFPIEGRTAVEN